MLALVTSRGCLPCKFKPIDTLPVESILNLSVALVAPSAPTPNTSSPGISLTPGVPSTRQSICPATFAKSPPSAPKNLILPKLSPS